MTVPKGTMAIPMPPAARPDPATATGRVLPGGLPPRNARPAAAITGNRTAHEPWNSRRILMEVATTQKWLREWV